MANPIHRFAARRDTRIDLVRGVALMMIFVDHIPGNTFAHFTLQNFGFADAAEVFVLIAGYSAAIAFGPDFRNGRYLTGIVRILARCWHLYTTHVLLFSVVCALVASFALYFNQPNYLDIGGFAPVFYDPSRALPFALTLTYLPAYLDILPLYIVLLFLFPAIYGLVQLHSALALAASVTLYTMSRIFDWTLPSSPDHGWFFNPLAWQLLFVIGIAAGHGAACGRTLARPRWLTALALAYVAYAFIIAAPWTRIPGLDAYRLISADVLGTMDKTNLSACRALHVLAMAYLLTGSLGPQSRLLSGSVARSLIRCGRHSLEVFAVGTVLSFSGRLVLAEGGHGLGIETLVTTFGIVMLVITGSLLSWHTGRRSSGPASEPKPTFTPETTPVML